MRITNGIINNNTKSNILVNKEYSDKYNTMVATGQKITRPSDDPIVAIRALRLNNNISEINQFYGKNIPDAEAWLEITETALKQTEGVLSSVQEYLTQGASDDNTAEDRKNILENLKGLRDQIYSSGNADYAGRTVFTGYRTGESLTYLKDETQLFTIVQNFNNKDLDDTKYVSGTVTQDPADIASYDPTAYNQTNVEYKDISRIKLAYEKLTDDQKDTDNAALPLTFTIKLSDGSEKQVTATRTPLKDSAGNPLSQSDIDDIYTSVPAGGAHLIPETGELILASDVADDMRKDGSTMTFTYAKSQWDKNDPRPEHYFAAITNDPEDPNTPPRKIRYNYSEDETKAETDPDRYYADFKNQKIQYEIAYNQKVEINVNANEVYTPYITRNVDELLKVTQDCQSSYEKLKKIEGFRDNESDETNKAKLNSLLDAAQKEYDYYKEKMQKTFSESISIFKGYTNDLNNKISALGSLDKRVELTKSRVSDQLQNFKELADSNINVELTESAIDLKNAETALQAAQAAAAKVAKTTLLDYL
ncbi:MAG: hypothetical protein K5857_05835 [Lachnospiraceae bacterium]|nr:hypothetical protein [Lachnospiraceae bacterium]